MSKKPQTKLQQRKKHLHAVLPPGEAEKPVEGAPAQQADAVAAPLLPRHVSVPELWADLERTVTMLVGHFNADPKTLDVGPLKTVMGACIYMLLSSTRVGGGRARAAIIALYEATRQGCEHLADAARHEKSRDVVKAFACEKSDWPVMVSPKSSSHDRANEFLADISVGTASNPPTANTKLQSGSQWVVRAVMLIDKINVTRPFLALEARNEKSNSVMEQRLINRELVEAHKWPEVMKLPAEFNVKTRPQYWSVAKKMLKVYWETNPDEAKADFKMLEESARRSLEKSGEITGKIFDEKTRAKLIAKARISAIHSVREAFYAIAAKR